MIPRALQVSIGAVALVAAAASPLASQTSAPRNPRLEIAPILAAYMPRGDINALFSCGLVKAPNSCTDDLKMTREVAIGGRVTGWLGKRAAIEGSLLYSPSGVRTDPYVPLLDPTFSGWGNGTVLVANLRGVFSLVAPVPGMSVIVTGGPAVIRYGGRVWSGDHIEPFGGTLGFGLDVHPGSGVGFRAAIDGYQYKIEGVSHHDTVVSLSLAVSPFRAGRH